MQFARKIRFIPVPALILLLMPVIFFSHCGNSRDKDQLRGGTEKLTGFEKDTYVNFRSFQNPDMTWGFTIFVNSMPYRHYNRIPFKNTSGGFISRNEADKVAELFVKLIREGDTSPRLNSKSIDTLRITIKN